MDSTPKILTVKGASRQQERAGLSRSFQSFSLQGVPSLSTGAALEIFFGVSDLRLPCNFEVVAEF